MKDIPSLDPRSGEGSSLELDVEASDNSASSPIKSPMLISHDKVGLCEPGIKGGVSMPEFTERIRELLKGGVERWDSPIA